MRLAVDHILDMKGESKYLDDVADAEDTNVTAKPIYKDWESIAAISPASPYPYYFEGLIYHIQGNESKAKEAYKNALINPLFSENSAAFYYLNELSIDELSKMRDDLAVIESDIYAIFSPRPYGLERHPMNFNDEYLRAKDTRETNGEDAIPNLISPRVEDIVVDKLTVQRLHDCIKQLTVKEQEIIDGLFFQEKSESMMATEIGISQQLINYRKQKILIKLKKLLNL